MSSHHFVKEGQEPALFIVDPKSLSNAEPLLEWAPLVVVTGQAVDQVLHWGIKIDVVLSRVDDVIENQAKVMDQQPVEVVPYTEDVLKEGILFLINTGQKGVTIMADTTEEHFELNKTFPQFQISILNGDTKWIYHHHGTFSKWLPATSRIYIRKDFIGQVITWQGLQKLDDSFEVAHDGLISIQSNDPFWVGESL